MRRWLLVAVLGAIASCGGQTVEHAGGDSGAGTGGAGDDGSGGAFSLGGAAPGDMRMCPPVPSERVYSCAPRPLMPTDCPPLGEPDSSVGYQQGCALAMPEIDSFSQCGPEGYACVLSFMADGTQKPVWITGK